MLQCFFHKPGSSNCIHVIQEKNLQTKRNTVTEKKNFVATFNIPIKVIFSV